MTIVEFRPTIGGAAYDPQGSGGSVSRLVMYPIPARSGPMVADVGPAIRAGFGLYEFRVTPEPPPGRYYAAITWRPTSTTEDSIIDVTAHIDFPLRSDLLVSAEDVAVAAGIGLPLDAAQREDMWVAIGDAQDAVVGAIGSITPTTTTEFLMPYGDDLSATDTWFDAAERSTVIVSAIPTTNGTYRVTYRTGLDGAVEAPILRYIRAHAAAYYAQSPDGKARIVRVPTSVSAEGQSVSYGSGAASARTAAVTSASLADLVGRYTSRRPRVFQRRGAPLMRPGPTETGWYVRAYDDGPFFYEV